jgi:hypothetical protein
MALRVFVLLTVLGTTYGFLVGGLMGLCGIGLMISGPIYGAIAGLSLGVIEGLVLGVLAVVVHRGGAPGDFMRYRWTAQMACAVACILAVATFWGVVFWGDTAGVRLAFTRDLPLTLILVVGPLLVATGATWVAARKVVSRYAREVAAGSPLEERYLPCSEPSDFVFGELSKELGKPFATKQ